MLLSALQPFASAYSGITHLYVLLSALPRWRLCQKLPVLLLCSLPKLATPLRGISKADL